MCISCPLYKITKGSPVLSITFFSSSACILLVVTVLQKLVLLPLPIFTPISLMLVSFKLASCFMKSIIVMCQIYKFVISIQISVFNIPGPNVKDTQDQQTNYNPPPFKLTFLLCVVFYFRAFNLWTWNLYKSSIV